MKEKTLYDIFKAAIEGERDAQAMYRLGAELAGSGTALRAMFRQLEEMERTHEEVLIEQYAAFKAKIDEAA